MCETFSQYLRIAMAGVAELAPSAWIIAGDQSRPPRRPAPRPDPRRRFHGGPQSHPVPEVCIGLEGLGVLEVAGRTFAMSPGVAAVLPPGMTHCEGYARADQTYAALWIIGSGASLLALVSRHRARRGWDYPFRSSFKAPCVRRLVEKASLARPTDGVAPVEALRADLLSILAGLHEREVYRRPSPEPTGQSWRRHQGLLTHIRSYLDDHLSGPVTIQQLSEMTRLTPRYLNRLFRQWTGEAIHEYLTRRRMDLAMKLCREDDLLAKQIAARVGYDDPLYFSRAFRRYHGVSPAGARERGLNEPGKKA